MADRIRGRWLVLVGLVLSFASVAVLLLPPTTLLLVLSGVLGGTGGGLVITPVLVELSRRSDDHDRGTAFSLFSGALAGAIALGSVGAAPLIAIAGFEVTIVAGLIAIVVAAAVAIADRGLSLDPRAATGARATA
jgi:predicted MFS family arabinose efflux permease